MRISFQNKTKVVATLGPASNSKEKILELITAGVDVFRLNFSHGTHEDHQKVIDIIKELRAQFSFNIGILQDLQGPKIRTREVENNGVEIVKGQQLIITTERIIGTSERISCTYTALPNDVKKGDLILLDDGKLELKVESVQGEEVYTTVVHGGTLKSRKGINLPYTKVSAPCLTPKDREDLDFGLLNNVDWVALSFVRDESDMVELRKIIAAAKKETKIIAKIEKPEALANIEAIIEQSDAVMVARGDLGVEIILEDVPMHQKKIVNICNRLAKPVIIATQVMESMITNPRPTRAETSDIANAVLEGADALMLSAETASGKYPVETVLSMVKTIKSVETQADIYNRYSELDPASEDFVSKSVVRTACNLAKVTEAKAIIGMTKSGFTAFQSASYRPKANIYIFTDVEPLLSALTLVWGVRAFYYDKFISTDVTFKDLEDFLVREGLLHKGDVFINLASMPMTEKRKTNTIKIEKVR